MTREQIRDALRLDYRAPHDVYRPKVVDPRPPLRPSQWPRKWN